MSSTASETKKRRIHWPSFSVQIVLGLIAGVLLGWLGLSLGQNSDGTENALVQTLDTIGSTFVSLLTAVVPPLVFTAIVSSIANLRGVANGARLAAKTLMWFAITALIAVSIGIVLGVTMKPGVHAGVSIDATADPEHTGSWLDFLNGIIPANFLGGEVADTGLKFNVLQIIVIALVMGIAALRVGKKAKMFLDFNASVLAVV